MADTVLQKILEIVADLERKELRLAALHVLGAVGNAKDAATLVFETDRGAVGSLVASQVTPGRKNRLWFSLDGATTSMAFDQELPESLWVGSRESTT